MVWLQVQWLFFVHVIFSIGFLFWRLVRAPCCLSVCLSSLNVARQQLGKHIPTAMNTHVTIQELLDVVFCTQSVPYQTLNMYRKGNRHLPGTSTFMSGQRGTAWSLVGSPVFCLHCPCMVHCTMWGHISLVFISCDFVCLLVGSCDKCSSHCGHMTFQTVMKGK